MEQKTWYQYDIGTGAYIGDMLADGFYRESGRHTETVVVSLEPYATEEREVIEWESYVPEGITDVPPPQPMYKAAWTGAEWVETGEPPDEPEPPEPPEQAGQLSQDEIDFVKGLYDGAGGGLA